jgi:deazaflavin-dependent oxidoreductase (nitroreductase family)
VDKRRVSTFVSAKLLNPLVKAASERGIPLPSVVILETIGRKSGQPRRTPVGKSIEGDTLWIVAEHGHKAGYVRNIQANPRVRVKVGRRWRTGTARLMPDDDPRERQRRMPNSLNSFFVRVMASELLSVRIDLDPEGEAAAPPGRAAGTPGGSAPG